MSRGRRRPRYDSDQSRHHQRNSNYESRYPPVNNRRSNDGSVLPPNHRYPPPSKRPAPSPGHPFPRSKNETAGQKKKSFSCLCFACFVRTPVEHMTPHSFMHIDSESRRSFYCGQCYVLLTRENLKSHRVCFKKEATLEGENLFTCPGCGFKSESPIKQEDHFRFCHRYDCRNCCDRVYAGLHNCDKSKQKEATHKTYSDEKIDQKSKVVVEPQDSKLKIQKLDVSKPAEGSDQVDLLTIDHEEPTSSIKRETTSRQLHEILIELPRDDDDIVNFRNFTEKENKNEVQPNRKLNLSASLLSEIQRALSDDTNSSEEETHEPTTANRSVMNNNPFKIPGSSSKKISKSKTSNNLRFSCNICSMTSTYKSSVKYHIVTQHNIVGNRIDEYYTEVFEDDQSPMLSMTRNQDCQTDSGICGMGRCCKECKIKDKNIKRLKTSIKTLLEMTGAQK